MQLSRSSVVLPQGGTSSRCNPMRGLGYSRGWCCRRRPQMNHVGSGSCCRSWRPWEWVSQRQVFTSATRSAPFLGAEVLDGVFTAAGPGEGLLLLLLGKVMPLGKGGALLVGVASLVVGH